MSHLDMSPDEVRKAISEDVGKLELEIALKADAGEYLKIEYTPYTVGVRLRFGRRKGMRRSKRPFLLKGRFGGKHIQSRYPTFEGLARAVRAL